MTPEELEDFETVELTIRKQILAHVAPTIGIINDLDRSQYSM